MTKVEAAKAINQLLEEMSEGLKFLKITTLRPIEDVEEYKADELTRGLSWLRKFHNVFKHWYNYHSLQDWSLYKSNPLLSQGLDEKKEYTRRAKAVKEESKRRTDAFRHNRKHTNKKRYHNKG